MFENTATASVASGAEDIVTEVPGIGILRAKYGVEKRA